MTASVSSRPATADGASPAQVGDADGVPTLTFRLLGPVELSIRESPVNVPGGRARAVLALLLLNANAVVSVERIINAVWGDRSPATARTQVQVRVSALRRLLTATDGSSIYTHPAGYQLIVDRTRFDLAVFDDLARVGRVALAQRRPVEAARALHAALALWRGAALGGVVAPFAASAVVLLEERRFAVLADRVRADLELGRHNELIPELRQVLMERPLLEVPRAQLMLALHRAGRRGDALTVYREGCRLLRDELGVDPGPELARAHLALVSPSRAMSHLHRRVMPLPPGVPPLRTG